MADPTEIGAFVVDANGDIQPNNTTTITDEWFELDTSDDIMPQAAS